ncbi:hypothetical protein BKG71_23505 [Mycobacteroides chelonae]|uniref:hypothetical protein n=1 Tax=Mycobacteroides TaxID=670516 RepID=UPI000713D701|nr:MULTISPECIES: hypothetical protein [Mycobacteroides]KRQ44554.1 hypothetical protein AOT88_21540 [Mycobacteroides sp. H063]OHT95646.1 hypothetical protein BKG71_23505 [Mycobacteroides chelonae]
MTSEDTESRFVRWADALLAGTGWTVATAGAVTCGADSSDDLAAAALADGFAAAAKGLRAEGQNGGVT